MDRMFTRQSSQDARIAGRISGGLLQVAMLEYSLRVDRVLAVASETWGVSEVTLQAELTAIERAGALLKRKASFISIERRSSAQSIVEHLETVVHQYRRLLPSVPEQIVARIADPPLISAVDAG